MTRICKMAAMLVFFASIASCKGNKTDNAQRHWGVDKQQVMPYVTCSEQAIDSLLAIADSVYLHTDKYKLEDLGMENEDYNKWLKKNYNDTLPTVIALFDSYSRITNSGMDEADASFAWHEVARCQMKHFYETTGNKWQEPNGYETLFRVINGMMGTYSGGSQSDMNTAAWRSVMPVDYRLVEVYKRLMDLCNDTEMVKLVHDDYMYTLKIFREYCASSAEWYSDLPREQGEMFQLLLESKLNNVKMLIAKYQKGSMDKNAVKKNLTEHRCFWGKNKCVILTAKTLSEGIE